MTSYINPESGVPKEFWLEENGQITDAPAVLLDPDHGKALVCLVNNGSFTAAGVVTSIRDLADFTDPEDLRSKTWFEVDLDLLTPDIVGCFILEL